MNFLWGSCGGDGPVRGGGGVMRSMGDVTLELGDELATINIFVCCYSIVRLISSFNGELSFILRSQIYKQKVAENLTSEEDCVGKLCNKYIDAVEMKGRKCHLRPFNTDSFLESWYHFASMFKILVGYLP